MRTKIFKLLDHDWHFMLLVIFFITHGYAEHVRLVPLTDLLLILLIFGAMSLLVWWLCKRLFKDRRKAALFTTFFMTIMLFFGAFQDFLGDFRFTSALAQLKILVPAVIIIIIIFFIVFKLVRWKVRLLHIYLNALLIIYIVIDTVVISMKLLSPASTEIKDLAVYGLSATRCDTCTKPSIYLVLLDEYSGSDGLKAYFNYDNSRFEQFLANEGFKVNKHTNSNYLYTLFSMASTLNMDYLHGVGVHSPKNHYAYRQATRQVRDNIVTHFFRQQGYAINNYSYFQLPGAPAIFKSDYLPSGAALITGKTMYSRMVKEAVRVLAKRYSIAFFQERSDAFYIENNEEIMKRALNTASHNAKPSFNYLHLIMPHDPVAFDSLGRRIIPFWKRKNVTRKEVDDAYLQYLVYTNNRMMSFIAALKKQTNGQAIILLMSDHGFRGSKLNGETKWLYSNFNAVYVPGNKHAAWYDGMSNVNQFRVLLNSSFGQKLPVLKDSLVR